MSDGNKIHANDGWTMGTKGYTPAPGKVQNGYPGPTTGSLGTPPTTGSAVIPPAPDKKG